MRHSQAVVELSEEITKDVDKPLTDAGIHQLDFVRSFIKENAIFPDLVLCSSSARTRQTLEWIQEALGSTIKVEYIEDLYGTNVDGLIEKITSVDDSYQTLMIIGHNPSISDSMQRLATRALNFKEVLINLPAQPSQLVMFDSESEKWADFETFPVRIRKVFEPEYNV